MHITTKGQVTIPQEIRDSYGFLPNTEVTFVVEDDRVYLQKIDKPQARGETLIKRMTGAGTVNLTTDEIMALTRDK